MANCNRSFKTERGNCGGSGREYNVYNLSRQICIVSSSGTFVNREVTSKEHIIPLFSLRASSLSGWVGGRPTTHPERELARRLSVVMFVCFGPICKTKSIFNRVLVGGNSLKYANEVGSKMVIVGVHRGNRE